VVAASGMKCRSPVRFNLIGGLVSPLGITMPGYYLCRVEVIEENLEVTILIIGGFPVPPIMVEPWKAGKEHGADDPVGETIVPAHDDD
jgi:hypothetical protein